MTRGQKESSGSFWMDQTTRDGNVVFGALVEDAEDHLIR